MNEQEIVEALLASSRRKGTFDTMTDSELADILLSEIWANTDLYTRESDLISAVIDRLRGDK